jgi:hypothetical protein
MAGLITTQKPISELVRWFEQGEIAVPEIQRDVVWKAEQVKQLMNSVFLGYPCGSLIFWEPRESDKGLVKSMIRPERLRIADRLPRYFLLDGQQRLTALASVFLTRDRLKNLLAEIEEEMPFIFVNMRRFPEDTEATTDPAGYSFPWFLLPDVLTGGYESQNLIRRNFDEKGLQRIKDRVQLFRDYQFPVQIIQDRHYEDVAEIFARVNSMGTQLTGAEIHLARIVPHWRGITKHFRDYRAVLRSRNYDMDLTFLMRAIAAIECNTAQIAKLAALIRKEKLGRNHLDRTWRTARRAIDRVIRTLQTELKLDSTKFFPSKNVLIPLVYYVAREKNRTLASKQMLRLFLCSQFSERYGGGAETAFRKDFRIMTENGGTARKNLEELADTIAHEARQYYRGLRIRSEDISGVPSKNVMLLIMYVLMRQRGATDWETVRARSLHEIEPTALHLHHIFPFNFMTKDRQARTYAEQKGLNPAAYRAELNDIANLTFLSNQSNSRIGDLPPSQYIVQETTKEMRRAHFIPEDKSLWVPDRYGDFLDARRKLIAEAATRIIKPFK